MFTSFIVLYAVLYESDCTEFYGIVPHPPSYHNYHYRSPYRYDSEGSDKVDTNVAKRKQLKKEAQNLRAQIDLLQRHQQNATDTIQRLLSELDKYQNQSTKQNISFADESIYVGIIVILFIISLVSTVTSIWWNCRLKKIQKHRIIQLNNLDNYVNRRNSKGIAIQTEKQQNDLLLSMEDITHSSHDHIIEQDEEKKEEIQETPRLINKVILRDMDVVQNIENGQRSRNISIQSNLTDLVADIADVTVPEFEFSDGSA